MIQELELSCDDGYISDVMVAGLWNDYGVRGIFYIPKMSRFERLDEMAIRWLSENHEIGSHTLDHCKLSYLPIEEQRRQIKGGRLWLERVLRKSVVDFSYPRGWHTDEVVDTAIVCGVERARTMKQNGDTKTLRKDIDPMRVPITFHFHPYHIGEIDRILQEAINTDEPRRLAVTCHSWELEKFGMWKEYETFIKYATR